MKHQLVPAAPWRAALLALVLGAGIITTPAAYAQANAHPPERMTYQGFLVDGNGAVLGSSAPKNYDVIFRIWSSENGSSGPERLWSEQQTVTVDKGYFSVLLGEGTGVDGEVRPVLSTLFKGATASDRWVGITVKGIGAGGANVDILPRMRLLTSPYAFLAEQATKLVREDNNADLISSSGNVLSFGGHLDVLGNNSLEFGVGIPKQGDAGRIGYQLFGSPADSLDIVGAGTTANNRKVRIYAEGGLNVTGPVNAPSFNGAHTGDGSGLTGLPKLSGGNTFSGNQILNNRLGIGEASPGARLHAQDTAAVVGILESSSTSGTWLALRNSSVGGLFWQLISTGSGNGEGAGKLLIGRGSSAGATAIRMTLEEGGDVGIGTTDPSSKLHVNGSVGIQGSSPLELGKGFTKEVSAGQIGYGTHSGGASGSLDIVGAGTTSGNRKIQMWAEGGLQVNTGSGKTAEIFSSWISVYHGTDKGKRVDLDRIDNGVRIWANGGGFGNASGSVRQIVWDGDGNWDASSDRKLKKNIEDAEPVLDRALQVQLRRYNWKDETDGSKKSLGVIAQELQPLFPEMVGQTEEKETGETHLTVGYSDFGMIAIKAIQELKVRHDAEVNGLKAELTDLKAQMKQVLQAAAELKAGTDTARTTAAVTK